MDSSKKIDAVVITGAGRGLGRAVAMRFGANHIPVMCIARTESAASTRDDIVACGGTAESCQLDLGEPQSAENFISRWINERPYKHIGVVLAAGVLGNGGGLAEADWADWSRTFVTNVLGNLAIVRGLLPRMLTAKFGRIVTLAGGGAAYGYPLFYAYAISKTAMVRATENLQAELKGCGDFLTVCLAPGAMDTLMLQQVKKAGGEVRTIVPMDEAVTFIWEFLHAQDCAFSGRFVHVRDDWRGWLKPATLEDDRWFLRRVE
jgi:NAD(P)-dependent dehydrogenase (short-subunit alcohol dehydrogenase family)